MTLCEERRIFKATTSVVSDNLVITLPNVNLLENQDIIRFVICNTIDTTTNPLGTVSIVMNGVTFPLKTKLGNDVRIEQLTCRKVYTIQFGAQTPEFAMLTCLPPTRFIYTTYPATTTTVTPGV